MIYCIITSSLNDKRKNFLRKCVKSLKNELFQIDITIVTNKKQNKKSRYVVEAKYNAGFAEMQNTAISSIKDEILNDDWVLFINDDAYLDSNFFNNFKKVYKNFDVVIPLILSYKGERVDSFGINLFSSGYAKNNKDIGVQSLLGTGACLLVRWKVLKKIESDYGFIFNALYYFYLEDLDFSLRLLFVKARIKAEKSLRAYHFGSLSTGKKSHFSMYYTYRNVVLSIALHWSPKLILRNSINILVVQLWAFIYSIISFNFFCYPKIFFFLITNLKSIMRLRSNYQSKRPGINNDYLSEVLVDKMFETKFGFYIPSLRIPI